MLGKYEAKDERMKKYLGLAQNLQDTFNFFQITRIRRSQNSRADLLNKLASTSTEPPVKVVQFRSIAEDEVNLVATDESNWMTPILTYLEKGELPDNKTEARQILIKSAKYVLERGILFRRSYLQPLLRCVGPEEADYVLREVHEGSCGSHIGAWALSKKVMRWGYYWPTLYQVAVDLVKRCLKCQAHGVVPRLPPTELTSMQSPWPFRQWGIDLVGPFDQAPEQYKFLIVAIDYFTKWVEAEPLAKITSRNVLNFVGKNIVCRFGIPKVLISDNGTQFTDKAFREWCKELQIQQKFTSVAHPQANEQTEVTNRTLVNGLKNRLEKAKREWVENLPQVLWSHRTTPRTSNGETPYSLVYGTEAVIPVEIGLASPRVINFSEGSNKENLRAALDLLEERREKAYVKEVRYKQQVARYYNQKVKSRQFQAGDLVLRNNEISKAEKLGKLEATWEGPYQVDEVLGKGSYKLVTLSGEPIPCTWHAIDLKRYFV